MSKALKGARYVGVRAPLVDPQGNRIDMHVVAVDHPAGRWEAIYCKTKEQAEAIAQLAQESDQKPPTGNGAPERHDMEVFVNRLGSTGAIVCSCGLATTFTTLSPDCEQLARDGLVRLHERRR
jgi:hypothetical protein